MADNSIAYKNSADTDVVDTFATDDIGGVKFPRTKITVGADGTNDGDVSSANPLPVSVSGTALTRLTDIETNTDSGAVVGNGAAATAQRVTLSNDSTGIVALTTSTASIGKLAANSGVDIGDVDVTSIAAGDNNIGNVDIVTVPSDPFGVNADAASATGSISAKLRFIAATGIPITGTVTVGTHAVTQSGTWTVDLGATDNAVLDAIAASVAGTLTVGTHAVTQSGTWNITNVSGTVSLPTGASTLAEQQSQTTHLATIAGDTTAIETSVQLIDDTVATLGTTTYTEAATKGLIVGAIRRDADTTLVDTTNEVGPLQMNAAGQLKVEVFSGEALPVTLTSTTITGTVAVTQSGAWDEVGINDSGNSITVDYATTGSGNATGALRVELANNGTGVIATVGAVTAITNALPAGTNNIGDVDIVSLPASTNTIEVVGDAAHDAAAAGNPLLIGAYASAAAPTDVSADADAVRIWALRNGSPVVNVAVGGTLVTGSAGLPVAQQGTFTVGLSAAQTLATVTTVSTVTNVATIGTSVTPGTGATNLGKAEDAAHNSGDVGVMMLAVRQDAHSDLAADGDYMPPTIDADGGLRVSVVAGGGTGGTAVADDADFTAGTTAGTPVMGVYESSPTSVTDGDLGTVGITVTRSLKVQPSGNVAHDAADSGNPVKVGARAAGTLSDDTMVANADRTDLVSDLDGALLVRTARPLGDVISERVSNTDGASTAFTNFGATASTRNVVTGYSVYNSSGTGGYIDFRDGTAGAILWTVPIPTLGGANFAIPDGIFRTTANTALAFDVSGALTTVYISVTGFKSKVT